MIQDFTAVIVREDDGYVSHCPELGVASQGDTIAEALEDLQEAVAGYLEVASEDEVAECRSDEFYVTRFTVAVG